MWKKVIRFSALPLGAIFGIGLMEMVNDFFIGHPEWGITLSPLVVGVLYGSAAVIFGLILFLFSGSFVNWLEETLSGFVKGLSKMPFKELLLCLAGFLTGLVVGFLISLPFFFFIGQGLVSISVSIVLYVFFAVLGIRVARSRIDDVNFDVTGIKPANRYVLDSSVIIDGRVVDLISLGFLSGEIIVPNAILTEIRRIADSEDVLKRARGRRGLDMLSRLQDNKNVNLVIEKSDEGSDIDTLLVKLSGKLDASIVTNDYNLTKLCQMQGIRVLNLNDLSNAVKPIMLPGEELVLQIVKDGKEPGQGVAYFDDGTMIVVEGGKRFVGQTVACIVTSVLQTSAGRMIFAKTME